MSAHTQLAPPPLKFSKKLPQAKGITDTHQIHALLAAISIFILVFIYIPISNSASFPNGVLQYGSIDDGSYVDILKNLMKRTFLHPIHIIAQYIDSFSKKTTMSSTLTWLTQSTAAYHNSVAFLIYYMMIIAILWSTIWLLFYYAHSYQQKIATTMLQHSTMTFIEKIFLRIILWKVTKIDDEVDTAAIKRVNNTCFTRSAISLLASSCAIQEGNDINIDDFHMTNIIGSISATDVTDATDITNATTINKENEKIPKTSLKSHIYSQILQDITLEKQSYFNPNFEYLTQSLLQSIDKSNPLYSIIQKKTVKYSSIPWYCGDISNITTAGTPTIQVPLRGVDRHHVIPSNISISYVHKDCDLFHGNNFVAFHAQYPVIKLGVGHEQSPDHHHGGHDHGHGHGHGHGDSESDNDDDDDDDGGHEGHGDHKGSESEGFEFALHHGDELAFDSVDNEILYMQSSYETLAELQKQHEKKKKTNTNATTSTNHTQTTPDINANIQTNPTYHLEKLKVRRLETNPCEVVPSPVIILYIKDISSHELTLLRSPIDVFFKANTTIQKLYAEIVRMTLLGIHIIVTNVDMQRGLQDEMQTLSSRSRSTETTILKQYAKSLLWNHSHHIPQDILKNTDKIHYISTALSTLLSKN